MLSKTYKSNKLFYDAYLYKLQVRTTISNVFKPNYNKEIRRDDLDTYISVSGTEKQDVNVSRYKVVTHISMMDANHIMNELLDSTEDFKVRCESYSLIIYTNNIDLLERISSGVSADSRCKIWKPPIGSEEVLLDNKRIVITNKDIEYEYRLYLKNGSNPSALVNWIKKNPEKAKIGDSTLNSLANNYYVNGNYFYVKDSKVLIMVEIIAGKLISKIEKFVHIDDLDK